MYDGIDVDLKKFWAEMEPFMNKGGKAKVSKKGLQ